MPIYGCLGYVSDEKLTAETLTSKLCMSHSQLFRKVKPLTDESPSEFIQNTCLDHAMLLLKNAPKSVGKVAKLVGFGDKKYFSARFKKRFGILSNKIASSI